MIRRTRGGVSCSLGFATGALFAVSMGGLSLAIEWYDRAEKSVRAEQAQVNLSQGLEKARQAAEAARAEIERLNRVRADQFQEIVSLRREVASVRAGLEAASTARAQADAAEIARVDRVRQSLFEELVRTRREAASARSELHAALNAPSEVEFTSMGQQTGALAPQPQVTAPTSAETPSSPQVIRPAGTVSRPRPVPATQSRPRTRPSSITKALPRNVEKVARPKLETTREAEVRPTPPALPSVLTLQGSTN
jgi:hypothetical protein